MSIEVKPFGVTCNLSCQYCYQDPMRDGAAQPKSYDLDRIKMALTEEGAAFSLFGGEPLLMPVDDLESLWAFGLERFGRNGLQTNGVLISDRHVELFRRYKVNVGISIDGPGELNDARWHGTLEKTREATAKTEAAIARLCREWRPPSLIVTLNRCNATAARLPALHAWVHELERMGVRSMRLHLLEVESPEVRTAYALSVDDNLEALLGFERLERSLQHLRFDLFSDMRQMLLGNDNKTTCIWNGCDPYTTRAVRGIESNGQRSNCGRTNKDGVDFAKADAPGFERYLALFHTPQAAGGCRDCRFFLMCKGQCPGTALDGDWRNRTEHCEVWMRLYEVLEAQLLRARRVPLSLHKKRGEIESACLDAWTAGDAPRIRRLLDARGIRT